MKKLVLVSSVLPILSSVLFAAACGDNNEGTPGIDGGVDIDAPAVDAPIDTPPTEFTYAAPYKVPLSPTGPDQIHSIVAGPGSSFYYAGFVAQSADPAAANGAGLKAIFVGKTTATGPDFAFGNIPSSGVALVGPANGAPFVTPTGSADEIDVAVQSDGKILVSFSIANTVDPTDRDVAVARLLPATGALDTTFGTDGLARIDFGAKNVGTPVAADSARGLTVDANNNIFVHASVARPVVGSVDSDFAVAKLTADGKLADGTNGTTAWGPVATPGKFYLDVQIAGVSKNATARGIIALADGSVLAGGYIADGVTPGAQPAFFKLTAAGVLDTTFNTTGYFHDSVLAMQTEIYNFALHGTSVVTGGYGRDTGTLNDFVSLKINTSTGARDLTWGGTTNGAKVFDPSGMALGSNCRNAIAMPGGKTLLLGSTGPGNAAAQDGVFAVLDANGNLDPKYGPTGISRVKFNAAADQNDAFWAGAVNGNTVMVAGWRGTGTAGTSVPQSATNNDDAYLVTFQVQ